MPTYEYQCKGCGHRFDVVHRVSDPSPSKCPECGEGPIQKIFTSVGIIFKGSGFHVNDYRKSEPKPGDGTGTEKKDSPTETPAAANAPATKETTAPAKAEPAPAAPAPSEPVKKTA